MSDDLSRGARLAKMLLYVACGVVALIVVGANVLVLVSHLGDLFGINHVSGVWVGLAHWWGEGVFYPPLFDGTYYGGTRYAPIPIMLHGTLAASMGDLVASGRIIQLVGILAMLTVMVFWLLRRRCPLGPAMLLAAAVLLTTQGWMQVTQIRNDTHPITWQLLALLAASFVNRDRAWPAILAGVLAATAVGSKFSAVWGSGAVGLWLLFQYRKALALFLAAWVATIIGYYFAFQSVSDGRMMSAALIFLFAGEGAGGAFAPATLAHGLARLLDQFSRWGLIVWLLQPIAFGVVGFGLARRRLTLLQVAWLVSAMITCYVFTNPGISTNHLLAFSVMTMLIVGEALAAWLAPHATTQTSEDEGAGSIAVPRSGPALALALIGAVLWVAISELNHGHLRLTTEIGPAVRRIRNGGPPAESEMHPESWRAVFPEDALILATNPTIPIFMGQSPVVLDPFMLRLSEPLEPEGYAAMLERVEQREFDYVITIVPIEYQVWDKPLGDLVWGHPIVDAMKANYTRAFQFREDYVYVPRAEPESDPEPDGEGDGGGE